MESNNPEIKNEASSPEFKNEASATDLDKFESRTVPMVQTTQEVQPTNILEYAIEKDLSPEQIEKFWNIQQKIDKENARKQYTAAIVRTQSRIKKGIKNRFNDQTKSNYADLEAVCEVATPIHTSEGIALSFYEGDSPKEGIVRTYVDIIHEGGFTENRFMDLVVDDKGIKGSVCKTPIHGKGSSFSYARRYLTCMVFNIPTGDDDDGNKAGSQVEFISDKQFVEIKELIEAIGDEEQPWLDWIGCESIEMIPASLYGKIIAPLKARLKK